MAARNKQPLNQAPSNFYTCHPRQSVACVICLICERIYHTSDFLKIKNTKFITNLFVICNNHDDFDLTLNIDESDLKNNARYLLTQTKLYERERYKDELNKSIAVSVSTSDTTHNSTILCSDDDCAFLKSENVLQKQLMIGRMQKLLTQKKNIQLQIYLKLLFALKTKKQIISIILIKTSLLSYRKILHYQSMEFLQIIKKDK